MMLLWDCDWAKCNSETVKKGRAKPTFCLNHHPHGGKWSYLPIHVNIFSTHISIPLHLYILAYQCGCICLIVIRFWKCRAETDDGGHGEKVNKLENTNDQAPSSNFGYTNRGVHTKNIGIVDSLAFTPPYLSHAGDPLSILHPSRIWNALNADAVKFVSQA